MDSLPEHFNEGHLKDIVSGKAAEALDSQKALLAETRKRIAYLLKSAFKSGSTKIRIELPDELKRPMKLILHKELFQRFPNTLYRRRVIEYADVDEFVKVTSEDGPISFDYEIRIE